MCVLMLVILLVIEIIAALVILLLLIVVIILALISSLKVDVTLVCKAYTLYSSIVLPIYYYLKSQY